jgi:hypothetical protein
MDASTEAVLKAMCGELEQCSVSIVHQLLPETRRAVLLILSERQGLSPQDRTKRQLPLILDSNIDDRLPTHARWQRHLSSHKLMLLTCSAQLSRRTDSLFVLTRSLNN